MRTEIIEPVDNNSSEITPYNDQEWDWGHAYPFPDYEQASTWHVLAREIRQETGWRIDEVAFSDRNGLITYWWTNQVSVVSYIVVHYEH